MGSYPPSTSSRMSGEASAGVVTVVRYSLGWYPPSTSGRMNGEASAGLVAEVRYSPCGVAYETWGVRVWGLRFRV